MILQDIHDRVRQSFTIIAIIGIITIIATITIIIIAIIVIYTSGPWTLSPEQV